MSTKTYPPSGIARENYASLDGLRAYAAIGIVMMHVQVNMAVKPSLNVFTERVIPWLVFTFWLVYAIGSHDFVLNNKVVKYLSSISMEIYLCHMMFYRVACMLHIDRFIHQCDALYVITFIVTLAGAICFSHFVKYYIFPFSEKFLKRILSCFRKSVTLQHKNITN